MADVNKVPRKAQKRLGRRRWADVVKFLTTTMKTAQSERVRMAAALRLADIMTLREQREMAELKAEMREEAKRQSATATPSPATEDSQTVETGTASELFARLLADDNGEGTDETGQ